MTNEQIETVLALHGLQPMAAQYVGRDPVYSIGKTQGKSLWWWDRYAASWVNYTAVNVIAHVKTCAINQTHLLCYGGWIDKGMPLPQ